MVPYFGVVLEFTKIKSTKHGRFDNDGITTAAFIYSVTGTYYLGHTRSSQFYF